MYVFQMVDLVVLDFHRCLMYTSKHVIFCRIVKKKLCYYYSTEELIHFRKTDTEICIVGVQTRRLRLKKH